jgi:phage tail-like protein
VNGSGFWLLGEQADWTLWQGMGWSGSACMLAGRQSWRLPPAQTRAAALAALAATRPLVIDTAGGIAQIAPDGSGIVCLDAGAWTKLAGDAGTPLTPKAGTYLGMSLGGGRLALLSGDGSATYLEVFDLRGRWQTNTAVNPAVQIAPDPAGTVVAAADDGTVFVTIAGGLGMFDGGPVETFVAGAQTVFAPLVANPNPLRQTALVANRPGGAPIAMTADATRVAILLDQGSAAQTLAVLDRDSGAWTTTPVIATDGTALPYMTDIGLPGPNLVALMAPNPAPATPADCAVVSLSPPAGVTLAPYRYPMLSQYAPRFAAVPGPNVFYLGSAQALPAPRRLLPLPYPAYLATGAIARFGIPGADADSVWHRFYAEAYLPQGTALTVWARAADTPIAAADQAALLALLLGAGPGTNRLGPAEAASAAASSGLPTPAASLIAALAAAPFHLQPPLAPAGIESELPFHPGLSALLGMPGSLHELLLQRSCGSNRRLCGAHLDLAVIAAGDGRHSPCLRAIRLYTPRFCYQDQYLPSLFHQTVMAGETDENPASPPDFRERLFGNLEGILTPLENRVAAAEYLLDPLAAPADMLPWLASYFGTVLDPGWPEARTRRALANMGRQFKQRGTYRGVCLALDIATDGAVQRGEVVLVETYQLRRTDATVLGIPMGGENVLTANAVPSGNSIIGDTLVLSAERAADVLALLAPGAVPPGDAAAVARFLDEYADRVQVAALLQGPSAATLRDAVKRVLTAELPAHLAFDIVVTDGRFVLGLSPLLDIDTFLDPATPPLPLTLGRSVVGRDAVVRNPATLRQ